MSLVSIAGYYHAVSSSSIGGTALVLVKLLPNLAEEASIVVVVMPDEERSSALVLIASEVDILSLDKELTVPRVCRLSPSVATMAPSDPGFLQQQ